MKKITTIENFKGRHSTENLDIYLSEYADGSGQPALVANIAETGEPFSAFTVNLIDYGIVPDEGNVIISDYSENEGTINELVKHGIVSAPIQSYSFGVANSAHAVEAKLLVG